MDARARAWLSLEGLSVGDAFGQRFFVPPEEAAAMIARRELPPTPWPYTDDTEMALSVVEVLHERGAIDQDHLAARFAARMQFSRGYSPATWSMLGGVRDGLDWRVLNRLAFKGEGSLGNGAAMRVAPLGAFFADEALDVVREEARRSAEITHAHAEGIAGAIAVAVAAALAWRGREARGLLGPGFLAAVQDVVPAGQTRDGIAAAQQLGPETSVAQAARALGNGTSVTAPDTVPFCLWMAARADESFADALWRTVSALGDRDTTCAIVGGILALKNGPAQIPEPWIRAREALPIAAA